MKYTIKHTLTIICLLLVASVSAQTIERKVINTTGGLLAPVGGPQLQHNAGETFSATLSGGGYMHTQGFIQYTIVTSTPITGTLTACVGSTTTLSNATSGGTWSSSNTSVATVGSTGVVSGVATGTSTISYTVSGSSVTAVVTVNPLPNAGTITGASAVCAGSTITLSNTTTGGTWSSSNTAIATIGTAGIVTGVAGGTVTISYAVTNSCGTASATKVITVNALSGGIPTSGLVAWYPFSGNANDESGNGNNGSILGAIPTADRNGNPNSAFNFGGTSKITIANNPQIQLGTGVGKQFSISFFFYDSGSLSSYVRYMYKGTGNSLGYDYNIYKEGGFTCFGTGPSVAAGASNHCAWGVGVSGPAMGAWHHIVVVLDQNIGINSGIKYIYVDGVQISSCTYYDKNGANVYPLIIGDGWWGKLDDIAIYNRALTPSEITQLYNAGNVAGSISGATTVCTGATTTLSNTTTGGSWSSSNTSVATVGSTGVVTGVASGTATISYTVTNACGSGVATKVITVNASPSAGTITGASAVCTGSTITLSNTTTGGTWSSSNTAIATVGTAGIVTGVAGGTVTISYAVTNSCGTATATKVITVNAVSGGIPTSGLVAWYPFNGNANDESGYGNNGSNYGATLTTDRFGNSGNAFYFGGASHIEATVPSLPIANAARSVSFWANQTATSTNSIHAGSVFNYGTNLTNKRFSGLYMPDYPLIIGESNDACPTCGSTLDSSIATPQNTWHFITFTFDGTTAKCYVDGNLFYHASKTYNTLLTVFRIGMSVPGHNSGEYFIGKIDDIAIYDRALSPSEITQLYNAGSVAGTITGSSTVCSGSTITLTDTTSGGTWSSSNTSVASVGSTGVVTGIASGTATISYTVTNACGSGVATKVITVNTTPSAGTITGSSAVCAGSTITLSNTTTGGSWSSSNTAIATVGTAGIVTGVAGGTVTISYAVTNSCGTATATKVVTVNALGSSIPTSGLVAWYPFNGNANDESGNGNNGTNYGAVLATDRFGVSGKAYSFDGESNFIKTDSFPNLHNNFSFSFWLNIPDRSINVTTSDHARSPISKPRGNCYCTGVAFQSLTEPGDIYATSMLNDTVYHALTGDTLSLNQWINVVISYNGIFSNTYINGVISTSDSFSYFMQDAITPLLFGKEFNISSEARWYKGKLDDIAIYNRALSPSEITQLYNAGSVAGSITGATTVCSGATTTFSNTTTGGSWSSSNTSVATVGSTGIVTGIASGTTSISYTVTNACGSGVATKVITVNPATGAGTITGPSTVNAGSTITLANATTGGTWSSSTTSVATVGSTGIVAGVAAGTTTISYTVSNACGSASATKVVTVNAALETPITGTLTVCTGSTTTLSNATSGGAWSSSNTMRATVNPAGIVSGISAGTVVISYSIPGGVVTAIVTVNAAPATGTFTGSSAACVGTTLTLYNSVPGGTWSSSTDGATVGSTGIVTGVAAGYAIISYTVSNECGTSVATKDVLIYAMPDAGTISGTSSLCVGTTAIFTSTETGGTWSSGYAAAATVSAEGVVSGVGAGNATISYRMTNFCGTAYATQVVTVNPLPNAGTIGGANAVCEGNTITMPFISAAGSWSSSNPSAATINNSTRVVTGIAAGTTTISFTVTNSCGTATSTKVITVNPDPVAGSLSGASVLCAGTTTTITPSISGGTWASSNPTFATVTTSGVVTGVAAGSITISYFITNGCGVAAATHALTISPAVSVGSIGGGSLVCAGNTITLTNTTSGGTWSSTNTAAAAISSTGVLTGVAAGNATISYTVSNSCGTATATKAVTVNPLPVAGTISGASAMCTGTTITLSSTGTGGSWISGAPSFASISSEGVVTATAVGTVMMTYRVINGCGTANATHPVTITTTPTVGTITGSSSVCAGSNITLSNSTSGGAWSSSATSIATIGSAGVVTGVAAGTTTISYTVTGGCGSTTASRVVTVIALPNAGTISGASSICRTATTTLSSTVAGGTWSSSYTAGASVSTIGLVTGVAAGAYTISYRMTNSCGTAYAMFPITILNAPAVGAIAGATTVCQAATTTLTNTAAGGAWSSTNTAAATIDANTGTATGVAAGTTTISYNVTNICGSAGAGRILTVNPLPVAAVITGTLTLSAGTTTTLTATPAAGTWLSASGTIASINAAGVVTGTSAGIATISYTRANTCGSVVTTVAVTVSVATTPITGTRVVCQGATTNLANATTGGAWSTANAAIATVGATGVVTGVGAGTTTITYSFSGGGNVTATVTVNAAPAAYTGSGIICRGSQLNLGSIIPGCTWTSGNTARATVVSTTGIVTGGTTLGTVNISYVSGGCRRVTQLTVNAGVATITGTTPSPCLGNTIVLASATGGGTWSSSNTARATINATSGLLTAVGGGTVTISYTVSAGCVRTATVTVGTPPTITGNPNLCLGQQNYLVSSGGIWSSSNTSVATIAASGCATGVSIGTAVITYRSTANAACFVTLPVTVNPLPSVIVPVALCPTETATLTSSPAGGTWTSAFPLKASVDPASGLVTAIILNSSAANVVNITYTLPTTCSRSAVVTVNQVPAPIGGGVKNICIAGTTTLAISTSGGTWSSATPALAAITAGGVVTGASAGLATISYTNTVGCASTAEVTVNAIPGANSGTASLCRTATTTLSNAAGAGTWSSSNSSTASVGMSTGIVTGTNVGTANITYSRAAGCISVTVVTVNSCGRPGMTEGTDGDNSVFTVSPNPTTGAINLTTDVAGKVVIYTIDGKQLQEYEAKAGTTAITLPSGLASGVYMLRFTGADGSSKMARLVYQQ